MDVNLKGSTFEQRRVAYSCNSLFVLIFAKEDVLYDREVLGEALIEDEDWGCIDPPGPIDGFGKIFTQDRLEEEEGRLTLGRIRALGTEKQAAEELFPYLDGWFIVNREADSFEEGEYSLSPSINLGFQRRQSPAKRAQTPGVRASRSPWEASRSEEAQFVA